LERGALPLVEPDLDKLFDCAKPNLHFSYLLSGELPLCDVVYIAHDVNDDNDRLTVDDLLRYVMDHARLDATIVILSPVPVGYTRRAATRPIYYQVETLIYGRAVERAMEPPYMVVGCADPNEKLPAPYFDFIQSFNRFVNRTTYESAELCKISSNCVLMASIAATNTLAELCEKVGADWNEIAPILRLDGRIGPYAYLNPGLGIGGGHFERDLHTVLRLAKDHNTDEQVVAAWINNAQHRRQWALRALQDNLWDTKKPKIAVWGITYKAHTESTKNSAAIHTMALLKGWGATFAAHDPAATTNLAEMVTEPLEALRDAEALAILSPWPCYGEIAPAAISEAMKGNLVVDPYRLLDRGEAIAAGLRYHTLGAPCVK
jgi:UDPglucose 6-dehydrogenase